MINSFDELLAARIAGCTLGKFRPGSILGARAQDYCPGTDCGTCGFHVLERSRRIAAIRAGALERGPDGLKRLYLGPRFDAAPASKDEEEQHG